jgi:prepilin-type N-terminal cleavage/methylation domain-containing protein/prepilin-type processing-associated H-X9-DG protein
MKILQRRSLKSGFTLIELLVVIAIIAILAAILFPVFAQARESARKISCLSNFKQASTGILMYVQDYDETEIPANTNGYNFPAYPCEGCGRPDYVWPELVQPYEKNWQIFRCPSDPHANDRELSIWSYDDSTQLSPSNPNYYYSWGARSDLGLNYVFLSPWVYIPAQKFWGSVPVTLAAINAPAQTMIFLDTIWNRDANGTPIGGGNWVVESPCIKDKNGVSITPTGFLGYGGWQPSNPLSWIQFGGAWPRHNKQINIAYVDGHCKNITVGALTAGCDVKDFQAGAAYDRDAYIWDLQ